MPDTPRRIFFDAVLRPHRSLPPQGFLIVMVIIGAMSFAAGIAFTLMGAWPVFGFFGLDVALVYWAFRVNCRSAQTIETVTLTDASLDVARHQVGEIDRTWSFEPTWVRILFNGVEARRPRLELRARDKVLQIGAFLAPHEREDLAKALEKALAERRAALPHLNPPQDPGGGSGLRSLPFRSCYRINSKCPIRWRPKTRGAWPRRSPF